jgi:hypothetical protein
MSLRLCAQAATRYGRRPPTQVLGDQDELTSMLGKLKDAVLQHLHGPVGARGVLGGSMV